LQEKPTQTPAHSAPLELLVASRPTQDDLPQKEVTKSTEQAKYPNYLLAG